MSPAASFILFGILAAIGYDVWLAEKHFATISRTIRDWDRRTHAVRVIYWTVMVLLGMHFFHGWFWK